MIIFVSNCGFTFDKTIAPMLRYFDPTEATYLVGNYGWRGKLPLPGPTDGFLSTLFKWPLAAFKAYQFLKNNTGTKICVNNRNASFPFRLVKRLGLAPADVELIYFARGLYFHGGQTPIINKFVRFLEIILSKSDDKIICQSMEDFQFLLRNSIPIEKLYYVGNGVKGVNFEDTVSSSRNYDVAYVGRISKEKAIDSALEGIILAAKQIQRKFSVVLVGGCLDSFSEDWFKSTLERLRKENDFDEWIDLKITGMVPRIEVFRILRDTKILLHCSLREGVPRALLEAIFQGVTPVAAFVRGNAEVMQQFGFKDFCYELHGNKSESSMIAEFLVKALIDRTGKTRVQSELKLQKTLYSFYGYDAYITRIKNCLA